MLKPGIAKLLIVDDNDYNSDFLSRRLKRQGYEVTIALDGKTALDFVSRGQVDVILLDIEMPVFSGLDVLQEVRRQYKPSELPVIMITAQHESSVAVEAFELGANDYVTKPIDFAVVNARIRTQLAVKRAEEGRRESEERRPESVFRQFAHSGRQSRPRGQTVSGRGEMMGEAKGVS